ncbi:IS200/IS605 family transposase [Methanonatronarchaeum sp. AMET-Sl]|uniref:IS200/IS605 family transposase n=1 Tax=Methanonatronarchaeum sp. AMET-Sl TaxID=3037654 RepID=UPI00244E57CA|nr:IS200/IS605 family transposase [Methanonatronarchaeum sp. AMET-Sl]WGI17282.1 IS200/IS605 family transposase [Methanonatronarchaeum sp. AMET-Sl]
MGKTRYSRYQINYHFVWIPKYRRDVLTGDVKESLDRIIKEIIDRMNGEVLSLEIQPDHVHLFVSMKPKYSPAKIINAVKYASSRRVRNEHQELEEIGG